MLSADSEQITVLVVDDDPVVQAGIRQIVNSMRGIRVPTAVPGHTALSAIEEHRPDIILFGSANASPPDSSSVLDDILNCAGQPFVVGFGDSFFSHLSPTMVASGISGVLPPNASPEEYERAIRAVGAGYIHYTRKATERLLLYREYFPDLSPRERQVLDLLSDGLSNQRIAKCLGIKETTVKMYVTRLLCKLQVESRVQAALKARGMAPRTTAGGLVTDARNVS